jgi:hypothetical protein
MMNLIRRGWLGTLAVAVSVLALSGCGSGGAPQDAVAVVGSTAITAGSLNHWMQSVVGGDLFERTRVKAPPGLVSDPPDYNRCVTAAEQIVPKSADGKPRLSQQELLQRCRQLNHALAAQALTLLISFAERTGEGAEQGITASEQDVRKFFERVQAEDFPKPGAFQLYLTQRDWVPSDEYTQLKRNIISTRMIERFKAKHAGDPDWQRAYGEFLEANLKKWKSKTTCRSGLVVAQCRQFKGTAPPESEAPAILLEDLTAGR